MFEAINAGFIKKTSYPDLIYKQVIDSIKDGKLHPGDMLPSENDFVKQMDVGRTSIREAMAALEYLNIIVLQNGRYYVNDKVQDYYKKKMLYHYGFREKNREDVFSVRRIFEMQFAMLAAQRATSNDLKYMYQIVTALHQSVKSAAEGAEFDSEDIRNQFVSFHRALAAAAHNSLLVLIFDRFRELMFFELDSPELTVEICQRALKLIKKLTKHIDDRDTVKSMETMTQYLDEMAGFYGAETKGKSNVQID